MPRGGSLISFRRRRKSIAIAISATMQMGIEPISAAAEGDQVQKRVLPLQLRRTNRGGGKRKRNLSRPATREMKTRNQFFVRVTWSGEKVVFSPPNLRLRHGNKYSEVNMAAVTFAPHNERVILYEASACTGLQSTSSKCACSPYLWSRAPIGRCPNDLFARSAQIKRVEDEMFGKMEAN